MPRTTKKKITTTEEEVTTKPSPKGKFFYAHGKRKTSIAQVKLYKGTGEITVNDKPITQYIALKALIGNTKSPLTLTGALQKFDIIAKVQGGGVSSQAQALRHAIAKALTISDPLNKPTLRKAGFLTRDSRIKERKKYGLKRARKGPQFSKR